MPEEQFFSLLTDIGAAQLTNAVALAQTIDVTEMAVGSGEADAYYEPTEAQTALKTEVFRGPINNRYVHPDNANWVVFELAIPAVEGPFTVREAAVFDDAGNMIGIMKAPETYKPALAQGSAKDLLYRLVLQTSNADQVELLVDPGVVLATHTKVAQDIADHEAGADPHTQYNVPNATSNIQGKVELATNEETGLMADADRSVTPAGLGIVIRAKAKQDLLNGLIDTIAEGSAARLIDAFPDPYTDLSGIDGALSSGHNLNATLGAVHNVSATLIPDAWSPTGAWDNLTGGVADPGAANIYASNDISLTGEFTFTFNFGALGTSAAGMDFGLFPSASHPITNFPQTAYGANPNSWITVYDRADHGNMKVFQGYVIVGTIARTTGTLKFVRDATNTVRILDASDAVLFTLPNTVTETLAVGAAVSTNSNNTFVENITVVGAPADLVLVSNTLQTLAVPSYGHLIGLVERVDPTLTYGVDLNVVMTRDDGTTWDPMAIEQLDQTTITVGGSDRIVDVVYAEGALTGAAETNGRYKWLSANTKELMLFGTAPEFS